MDDQSYSEELELRDYLRIAKRRWPWILVPALFVASVAVTMNLSAAESYQATARVSLGTSAAQDAIESGSQSISSLNREMSNEIALATGDQLRTAISDDLGYLPAVNVAAEDFTDILRFTAAATTPQLAADGANAYANAYVTAKQDEAATSILGAVDRFQERLSELRATRQVTRQPLDALDDQIAEAEDAVAVATATLTVATREYNELSFPTDENDAVLADLTLTVTELETNRNTIQRQRDRLALDLGPELDVVDAQINAVATNISLLQLDSELASLGSARILQVANPPISSTKSPWTRSLAVGLIAGLIIGLGVALLRENLDQTIKTVNDIERVSNLPVIGVIPKAPATMTEAQLARVVSEDDLSPIADGYFKIRSAVQFALLTKSSQTLLITSPNQSEGKSTTASNLAWSLATIGKKVALADVDFRRPKQHLFCNVSQEPGLSDHVLDGTPIHELVAGIDTHGHDLAIITAGTKPPRPADFVASELFNDAIRALGKEADLIVLDAPPVLPVADSLSLARRVDNTIMCVKAGSTTKAQLANALLSLDQVGAPILGLVLIGAKPDPSQGKYGYYEEAAK